MFEQDDQEAIAKFVKNNLARHRQFALATTDDEGKPWVVCLNLTVDKEFNFIWKSEKTTEHSKHIANNPNVAICVFSESEGVGDFGYYAHAIAHEVTEPVELERLLKVRYEEKGKPIPPINEFTVEATGRIYYAVVTKAWVNDSRHLKKAVDLEMLKTFNS